MSNEKEFIELLDKEMYELQIATLKNKLKEAEEKIKRLSDEQFETFKEMKEWKWHAQYNQNQKSIEELKKVLENCFIGKCEMFYDVQKDMYVPSKRDKAIIDFIENRIAELKGDRHEQVL